MAFIWHLYRLSIPIVRNYPVRRGRLVESAWEGGGCGRAGKLQVLLALVFVILPPTSRARNSLGVSQINFQVAPYSGRPKWLKGSTLRLGTNIVFN